MWNPFSTKPPSPYGAPQGRTNGLSHATPDFNAARVRTQSSPKAGSPSVPAPPQCRIATVEMMGNAAVATITVTELTQGDGAEQLAELLQVLKETGARHYVLDIQNIQFMDSMCLGCLVESLNDMAAHGGKIALVNTAQSVQSLFRMTRLDRVFPICRDVMHAIELFDRPAA